MFFKPTSSRRVRTPPTGFVRPAQPTLVDKPPAGAAWLHEVKHDGYRLLALKEGARVKQWTRHGTDFTDRFPRIAEAVRGLPAERVLLDGEAVVFRPDGLSDFEALLTKRGSERAAYVAFDLLAIDGEDRRACARSRSGDRRFRGSWATGAPTPPCSARRSRPRARSVFAKACALGLEGVVSERAGGFYKSGPSSRGATFGSRYERLRRWHGRGYFVDGLVGLRAVEPEPRRIGQDNTAVGHALLPV
jgi:bifunctional non-homologous end joining protein LigD